MLGRRTMVEFYFALKCIAVAIYIIAIILLAVIYAYKKIKEHL